ncbi:MAG: HD domain-containing protein [Acetobacter sp.]|nr:HD domain-containing protein [Acetobacter sp.]
MLDIISKALEFALTCHSEDCSGHDVAHILRVLKNAERILASESGADGLVVRLAAILHDVDDYKLGTDGQRVQKFFSDNDVSTALAQKVQDVVEVISFSKSGSCPQFETIEQKIVSDADKLDAMGAIGVCRTVMYSAATGRPLFNAEEFPNENLAPEEYKNKNRKGNHAINHFFEKLLKLKGAMQTTTGMQMAGERHQFMLLFLQQFFTEVGAMEWLEYLQKIDCESN